MNLKRRIELVNDMIKENPECTIKDYLELLNEIILIEKSYERKTRPRKLFEQGSENAAEATGVLQKPE